MLIHPCIPLECSMRLSQKRSLATRSICDKRQNQSDTHCGIATNLVYTPFLFTISHNMLMQNAIIRNTCLVILIHYIINKTVQYQSGIIVHIQVSDSQINLSVSDSSYINKFNHLYIEETNIKV
ncbi:hypothetical protein V6Z11_A11G266600 [Gossypium hirsutum]